MARTPRTYPAILASIAAGLMLAVGTRVLSAESAPPPAHIYASGEWSGPDTTVECQVAVVNNETVLVMSEKRGAGSSAGTAERRGVTPRIKGSVEQACPIVMMMFRDGEVGEDIKLPNMVHPHAALKQKPLKPKMAAPEVHSKKRIASPDQPWETEFLVRNNGQPASRSDLSFLSELA
jgi:hypothetical protein